MIMIIMITILLLLLLIIIIIILIIMIIMIILIMIYGQEGTWFSLPGPCPCQRIGRLGVRKKYPDHVSFCLWGFDYNFFNYIYIYIYIYVLLNISNFKRPEDRAPRREEERPGPAFEWGYKNGPEFEWGYTNGDAIMRIR